MFDGGDDGGDDGVATMACGGDDGSFFSCSPLSLQPKLPYIHRIYSAVAAHHQTNSSVIRSKNQEKKKTKNPEHTNIVDCQCGFAQMLQRPRLFAYRQYCTVERER